MPLNSFAPDTRIQSALINANFSGLADGSLINDDAIGVRHIDRDVYSAEKTTDQTITSLSNVTNWDNERLTTDSVTFNTGTGVLTINTAGTYRVTCYVLCNNDSGTARSEIRITSEINGVATEWNQKLYLRTAGYGQSSAVEYYYNFTVSDTLEWTAQRTQGTDTVSIESMTFSLERIS